MEIKKNKKHDLEPKRPMFFGIGMIVSISLVLTAFEWKSEIDPIVVFEPDFESEPVIIVHSTTHVKPKPPKPKPVIIKAVDEDVPEPDVKDIIEDILIDDPIEPVIIEDIPNDIETIETIFDIVETPASYEGGMSEFYKFLSKNLNYTREAKRIGIEGRVYVQFIVNKDGSLSEMKVIKGLGAGLDEEALRVMNMVNGFIPGKQRGNPVKVRMVVPIVFQLQ